MFVVVVVVEMEVLVVEDDTVEGIMVADVTGDAVADDGALLATKKSVAGFFRGLVRRRPPLPALVLLIVLAVVRASRLSSDWKNCRLVDVEGKNGNALVVATVTLSTKTTVMVMLLIRSTGMSINLYCSQLYREALLLSWHCFRLLSSSLPPRRLLFVVY